jgi:diadenosine tetraphosphatase ApaH/serine/threonine PP2A family protein phosphatase
MRALVSDIHGNYDALSAVFEDIDRHEVDEVHFLGDVVGYGPEPEKCIDLVQKRCSVHLLGNHDFAMLNAPIGFNPIAAGAIACLRHRMEPSIYSMRWKRRRWQYLGDLKQRHMDEDILYVHASPRDPVTEYILPYDPEYHPEKCADIFARVERACFVGHTHIPGVMIEEPAFVYPADVDYRYELPRDGKAVLNVGSVGQPRDRDPRASYVLFDGEAVEWRRVEYDIDAAVEKIRKVECLDDRAGERLRLGK